MSEAAANPGVARPSTPPTPRWRRWLGALNPISLALNALFHAEVRASGRRRGTYIFRFLAAGLISGAMLLPAVGMSIEAMESGGAERLQALQDIAPAISGTIVWLSFIGLCLAAPVLTAPVVCDERRMRTLPALLTTPLTAGQIVVGKLAARLVHVLIIGLVPLPVLLASRAFGGVEAGILAAAMGVVLASAVLSAALGLLASTWSRKASSASSTAVLMLFALFALPPLVLWTLVVHGGFTPSPLLWLASSPAGVLGFFTARMAGQTGGMDPVLIRGALLSMAVNLSLAGVVVTLSAVSLRRVLRAEGEGRAFTPDTRRRRAGRVKRSSSSGSGDGAPSDGMADASARADRLAGEGVSPATGRGVHRGARRRPVRAGDGTTSRVVGDHPVLWRELHPRARVLTLKRAATAASIGALMLWISYEMWNEPQALVTMFGVIGTIITCVIAATTPAPSIAGEREGRTLDELLTTPLRTRGIILAKAVGVVRTQWLTPSVVLAYLAIVGVMLGNLHPVALVHFALVVLIPIVLLCGVGVLLSTVMRKASTASAITAIIGVSLWAGLPMSIGILTAFLDSFVETDQWFTAAMIINPVALAGVSVSGAAEGFGEGHLRYHMPSSRYDLAGFTTIIIANLLVATLIAGACLALAWRILRRVSGRLAH